MTEIEARLKQMNETKIKHLEELGGAYTLSHPARAAIVALLRKKGKSYPAEIARELGLSERLVSFHLSMLSGGGFLVSEYALSNPGNPPRVVKYYQLTKKVDEALERFVKELKSKD